MMKPFGYTIHEYANRGSESLADVKHVMLNDVEFAAFFAPEHSSPGAQANINTNAGRIFRQRLETALRENARPGDIVAHIWTAYWDLPAKFPQLVHVETGIGYPNDGIGAYRIFESNAWMHFHMARYCSHGGVIPTINDDAYQIDRNPACTWVVPNYYDPAEWPLNLEPENCVVFMARFVVDKGIVMLRKIIKRWEQKHPDDGMRFVLAGMGGYPQWLAESDFTAAELARIDYRGVVNGPARAEMCGQARAMLLPSIFVEPFGGSGVEAMMCGTPLIAPTFGAFTETIEHGATGFNCRTVEDYVTAIENAPRLDRGYISTRAAQRFSLKACGAQYHDIFTRLTTQAGVE